ncbi:MAG: CPBP family intramembrane metalloprotease [Rhodospirillaceae bacterium]|jgi:membrane protease YdiL (CAAX protease family)|nr:CPBP family intramembrane metalloprotease [Rhodospirillaceae bacterium]
MFQTKTLMIAWALLRGLLFFVVLMGVSLSLIFLNAGRTPSVPWFPLPVIIIIGGATYFAHRRWGIRIGAPQNVSWQMTLTFGALLTIGSVCVSILQGTVMGMTRTFPGPPDGVSFAFLMTYLIMMPMIVSVLPEVSFRGIIQTRLETLMRLWPTLIVIAVANTVFHFNATDLANQWLFHIVLNLGLGYVTWISQSILPAVLMHLSMNITVNTSEYLWGPFVLSEIVQGTVLTGVIITAVLSFVAAGLLLPRLRHL